MIRESHSIVPPDPQLDKIQRLGLFALGVGLAMLFGSLFKFFSPQLVESLFWVMLVLVMVGGLVYGLRTHLKRPPGIQNNNLTRSSITARGALGWTVGIIITTFYVVYYWWPQHIEGMVRFFDPLSMLIRSKPADQWFTYGAFYTIGVSVMGVKAIVKYRHSRYQIIRTCSIILSQLFLAFLIPYWMEAFNKPYFAPNYFWPLEYKVMMPDKFENLKEAGTVGQFVFGWAVVMILLVTPILTYFYGKRWYCSWVCGCGGLANTAGDSWRQLSDKSLKAWNIERISIYTVLVFVIVMTAAVWVTTAFHLIPETSAQLRKVYGFLVGSVMAGVIGTGFYPILGTRTWCRFGCPMAAILGIMQRFKSRFRITTNGAQCISCGNCSKYCEMGIDVRWYAQRGQDIARASCVGCGMCSAVCPRGVLNLENGPADQREEYTFDLLEDFKSRHKER